MLDKNDSPDVEYGRQPPATYKVDDKTGFDHEPGRSVLCEDQSTTTSSRLTRITRRCILLSVLALTAWGIVNYTLPNPEALKLLEQATAIKETMSINRRAPTTNILSVDNMANNSANKFDMSFAGPDNGTSPASLKARVFPPTVYCDVKDDCDWGQTCSDGICQYGCESTDDCIQPQKCKKGWCEYKEKPCVWMPCGRKCLEVSHICEKKHECCSRICRRSALSKGYKVCMAGSRQEMVGGGDGDEEGDVEE